jgi:transcriptional regulator with XRE-family HTH domain
MLAEPVRLLPLRVILLGLRRVRLCPVAKDQGRTVVGARVARLRDERNMTQEKLAALAGVSRATIQALEKGRTSGRTSLPAIAAALGVTPGELSGAHELIEATVVRDGELLLSVAGAREVVDAYVNGDDDARAALLALAKVLRRQVTDPD